VVILDPVPQAVADEPSDDRVVAVHRIAGAGIVRIVAAVRLEHVIGDVLQPAERYGRSTVIPLAGVVEGNVQDDLDAGAVQRLDHVAELAGGVTGFCAAAVGGVGCEKAERRVPPIVRQRPAIHRTVAFHLLGVELLDWQELHRSDPE